MCYGIIQNTLIIHVHSFSISSVWFGVWRKKYLECMIWFMKNQQHGTLGNCPPHHHHHQQVEYGIDVDHSSNTLVVDTLHSSHHSSLPCRNHIHPIVRPLLAGTTFKSHSSNPTTPHCRNHIYITFIPSYIPSLNGTTFKSHSSH